ncbi:MAG: site-specific integrase [Verrucomicrobia bacterium]|nr:site-specific integrase [Verrucomicrobiota bacterium]
MKPTPSRKAKQGDSWPRKVQPGRAIVNVYRRKTPSGNFAFMVANYADGDRRRFDSYASEADALEAAEKLARRLDSRDYVAASMTRDQALEYANAVARLKPFNVTVDAATATVAQCLKTVGDLANLHAAAKFYAARHKQTIKKPVAEVVAELLKIKAARGASERYMRDLTGRLERFADDCGKDSCSVTTADIQDWLDGQKLGPQSYRNFRTVLHTLFRFAVARGYAVDNPVEGVERVKVNGGDVEIFTPSEITRLLEAAHENFSDFLPCLAIGAFAGLRSAEIERLEWSDIHLAERFIVVSASKAKTATRRIVPIHDNLAAWLAPYADRQGKVWSDGPDQFFKCQAAVAAATAVEADPARGVPAQQAVEWKANALRHSYASYRFAQIGDAGRVAGELGNSAAVVHKHYRELVKPADAEKWFSTRPEQPGNVLTLPTAVNAGQPR